MSLVLSDDLVHMVSDSAALPVCTGILLVEIVLWPTCHSKSNLKGAANILRICLHSTP